MRSTPELRERCCNSPRLKSDKNTAACPGDETRRGTPDVLWGRAGRTLAKPPTLSKKISMKRKFLQTVGDGSKPDFSPVQNRTVC
jgi:hypothetical protein